MEFLIFVIQSYDVLAEPKYTKPLVSSNKSKKFISLIKQNLNNIFC